jgi:hypothetical protein
MRPQLVSAVFYILCTVLPLAIQLCTIIKTSFVSFTTDLKKISIATTT